MERELKLRIVLQEPPAGVDFGLQKGKGSNYETVLKQRSTTKDLHFEFTVGLKTSAKSPVPDFSGPLVQGTRRTTICLCGHRHLRGSKRYVLEPPAEGPALWYHLGHDPPVGWITIDS